MTTQGNGWMDAFSLLLYSLADARFPLDQTLYLRRLEMGVMGKP